MTYSLTGGTTKPTPVYIPPPPNPNPNPTPTPVPQVYLPTPTYYDILTSLGRIYNVEHNTISGFINNGYTLPNFNIGHLYTLPYGYNSSVSLTYDLSHNIYYNFDLITGPQGVQGIQGPQGDVGASLVHPDENDPLSGYCS